MNVKDLFEPEFQRALNDANNAQESIIREFNEYLELHPNMTLGEMETFYKQQLQPIADELGVTFKVNTFIFPTFVYNKETKTYAI